METKPIRFGALDVFRGMTIVFMIIVNSPGNWSFVYGPLLHAEWHGFTPTDLVFPSFLFAIGTAMSFSMRKWDGQPGGEVAKQILKRTGLLFLFGYLMYWYPFFRLDLAWNFSAFPIGETRIFGVLQRIALAYGVAAALLHFAGKKWTYALVLLSLPVYWFLLATYGIEGLDPLSLEGNAVRALDLKLIGANHMYMGEGIAFDPEGLLTTLPSIANIVAGYAAGLFVQRERDEKNTRIDLMLLGASLCLVALVWNLAFPINKKLWTSSYVLLTIGLDLVILGLLMWFLPKDKKLPGWGRFFQTAGKNPLAIYLLSELALITLYTLPAGTSSAWEWAYTNGFSWMGAKLGSFAMAALFSLSCWAFGYWMDRRKWYWRV
jgi:predicted acyltransferase